MTAPTKNPKLQLAIGYNINEDLKGVSSWTDENTHGAHIAMQGLEALSSLLEEYFGPKCAFKPHFQGQRQIHRAIQQKISTCRKISSAVVQQNAAHDSNSKILQELNQTHKLVETHLGIIVNHLCLWLESYGGFGRPAFRSVTNDCHFCNTRSKIEDHLYTLCSYPSVALDE